MTSYKHYLCPPLTAGQKKLSFGLAAGLSILVFIGFALFAKPVHAQTYDPERLQPLTEETIGFEMWLASQTLGKLTTVELQELTRHPENMSAEIKSAVENVLRWAKKMQTEDIAIRNPFTDTKRYLSDSVKCVAAKDWLAKNAAQTTALWLYLLEKDAITDDMRETAESVVAMATAPWYIINEEDFNPYRDFDAFINYLALPHQLPTCGLVRGTSMFDMLVFFQVPRDALADTYKALTKQALLGDFEAIKHFAWLAQAHYALGADPT